MQYEQLGAVSSDHPLATQAGENVLKKGGNAFDVAAAMLFVLNVVQPLAGIGGGSEVVVHVCPKARTTPSSAEKSPAILRRRSTTARTLRQVGLNGGFRRRSRDVQPSRRCLTAGARSSPADALQPAIAQGRKRVPCRQVLATESEAGRTVLPEPETLRPDPAARRSLRAPTSSRTTWPRRSSSSHAGTSVRPRDRAAIVEAQKRLADAPQHDPRAAGRRTLGDLAAYDVDVRPASHLDHKGYDVYSAPPPSSGGVVLLETLGLLEQRFNR